MGHRRGVAGYFCALEEEQGVVRDIDIVLLAVVPTRAVHVVGRFGENNPPTSLTSGPPQVVMGSYPPSRYA